MSNQKIGLQSVFTITPISMIQYAGKIIHNEPIDRPDITSSTSAKIGDITINTETSSFRQENLYSIDIKCMTNTCNGIFQSNDEFGCPIYEYTTTESNPTGEVFNNGQWTCDQNFCDSCYNNFLPGCPTTFPDTCCAAIKVTKTCGGRETKGKCCDYNTCWAKFNIYKDNVLIKSLPWQIGQQQTVKTDGIIANLFNTGIMYQNECYRVENTYDFEISPSLFRFNITTPKSQYISGEMTDLNIQIYNGYKKIKGNLIVKFEIPTSIGSATKTTEEIKDLNFGDNIIHYSIPTEQVTDKIIINPVLDILMPGNEFGGINGICYKSQSNIATSLNQCDYVQLATIIGDTSIVNIIPKPLYLENKGYCPIGYTANTGDDSFCIRDDIKDLTCFQFGCPVIEGHEYSCTSSGFCSETVFIEKSCNNDVDCPTNTKCDVGSGLCIKTEIYSQILQCNMPTDCAVPCEGKTPNCISDSCVYDGECVKTVLDCRQIGCALDDICTQVDDNKFVCLHETTSISEKETFIKEDINIFKNVWIWGLIVVVGIIILLRRRD